MLFALNMIASAGYAVINKLKAIFKSNTVPLLTADSSVRAVNSGAYRFGRLPDLLEEMAAASSTTGALKNTFWGAVNSLSGVCNVSPNSSSAGCTADALAWAEMSIAKYLKCIGLFI